MYSKAVNARISQNCRHLVFYPNGKVEEDKHHFGIFLELLEADIKIIDVNLKLYLINNDAEEVYMKESKMHFDQAIGFGWGQFIEHRRIFNNFNTLISNDVLTIGCEVSLLNADVLCILKDFCFSSLFQKEKSLRKNVKM